ncbi:hypothetical protein EJ05DRAFT_502889 [Pseudovirgaria hyperparasitica]|uniref:DUF7029 domain-containing protein n=1 Tax=Pseudovirgaria hyperparasitica TaxID=470096 RepID=A0A6A6W1H9_9PEZI|nr:uncharacterized protein EJ05DRAFT_502889 [Pseudovirgaria hyperparasitica]KAF2755427.1 hypothetical protein EJ05DRAFT_502889 [Pseudovirgaria hyperparasitica]
MPQSSSIFMPQRIERLPTLGSTHHITMMKGTQLFMLLLGSICCTYASRSVGADVTSLLENSAHPRIEHRLAAASKYSQLSSRSDRLELVHRCDLDYASDSYTGGQTSHYARVTLGSERPILLLEQVEHLLSRVECSVSTITIELSQSLDIDATRNEIARLSNGYIITSHSSCNDHGERMAYNVKSISHDPNLTTTFEVEAASLESSFSRFTVSLAKGRKSHILRPHRDLRRRQDPSQTGVRSSIEPMPTESSTLVPTPTRISEDTSATFHLDKTITASLGPFENNAGQPIPITVGCKNCTVYGDIELDWVNFDWDCDVDELRADDISLSDCLQGGEVSISAKGLGARIELEANLTNTARWSWKLYEFPLGLAYQIPKLGTIGLTYSPTIIGTYSLDGNASVSTGFDITVPSDSNMVIDFSDLSNSSSRGFQDTALTPIPFSSEVSLQSLSFGLSLQHRIGFGISLDPPGFPGQVAIGAGVSLENPQMSLNITPIAGPVDASCKPLAGNTDVSSEDSSILERVLNHTYSLNPSIGLSIDFDAEFTTTIPLISPEPLGYNVYNHSMPIEDWATCLNWDQNSGTYVDAQQVFQTAKQQEEGNRGGNGNADSNGGGDENAATSVVHSMSGMSVSVQSMIMACMVVCGFMVLG